MFRFRNIFVKKHIKGKGFGIHCFEFKYAFKKIKALSQDVYTFQTPNPGVNVDVDNQNQFQSAAYYVLQSNFAEKKINK